MLWSDFGATIGRLLWKATQGALPKFEYIIKNNMNILSILDLVIGLFFIFFLFSIICTALVEGFAQFNQWRCKQLSGWIRDTFGPTLGEEILQHKLIKGLTRKGRSVDYIPAHLFATALLDAVYQNNTQQGVNSVATQTYDFNHLETAVGSSNLLPPDLQRFLLQAFTESHNGQGSLVVIRKQLESWYEEAMERLTGTYRKRTRFYTWLVAFFVTIIANVDTLALCKYLKDNPKTTAQLVNAATTAVQDSILYHQTKVQLEAIGKALNDTTPSKKTISDQMNITLAQLQKSKHLSDSLYRSLAAMGLPLGWSSADKAALSCPSCIKFCWCEVWQVLAKSVGWILTALALTLGAPFWFDTINKLVNIRSSGKKPEETPDKSKSSAAG